MGQKAFINDKLDSLLDQLKKLESELLIEVQKKGVEFGYEIKARKVHFKEAIVTRHKKLVQSIARYLYGANPLCIVTAPVIWFCVVPAVFMDVVVSFYQFVCFPIYGIPKVRRADYIVMDRGRLRYLNSIERWNCIYCEYFNGLIAYVQEIAGRTEQNWCPIKHAMRMKTMHSRYQYFLDYGDAEQYRKRLSEVRQAFEDLKKNS
ncbi:MAG TPA: hypothetical protein VL981_02385 [Candidatus Methylacidiphilales bacterium]|nr:hypothetical protein [Candidatus Methylacidiphilales bacterium]